MGTRRKACCAFRGSGNQSGLTKNQHMVTAEHLQHATDTQADGNTSKPGAVTERTIERDREEEHLTSVIVKRWDEARRHPDDILEHTIRAGREQIERRGVSLFMSATAAGLILGFSVMAVGVVETLLPGGAPPFLSRFAHALVYPVGFILCILSGTELFTEHTATALYPVLDKRASPGKLLKLWALVWLGNMVGALLISVLLLVADDVIGAAQGYRALHEHLVDRGPWQLLASAFMAGWLMALGAWLVSATPPSINQTIAIYLVTFLIGIGRLHHSIAGAIELFTSLFAGSPIQPYGAARFIVLATVGNLLGGSLMVAILNYGHIRKSREVT